MSVLIDEPIWPAHGTLWAHLVSDSSYAEVRHFAAKAGIPDRAFDNDHYDVPLERWHELVALGATPVTSRELLRRLQKAGLRIRQRDKS